MTAMTRRMFLMGGVSIFPYLYLERLALALRRYDVRVNGLPPAFDGFTILHLSDLHDKEFGPGGHELIDLVKNERFDMIALTGDLVVGELPRLNPALDLILGLRKAVPGCPCFAVNGNHDWRLERAPEFNEKLREVGAHVLCNRAMPVERGKDLLWVVGVDDPITERDRLDRAVRDTEEGAPRILLAHSPQVFPQAVRNGVALMLAGHTHGGQIRLPLVGAPFVPRMGLFPRWDYGMFTSGASTMIVSGGLGESGLPIRFNIRPELSLVTLRCSPPCPPGGGRPAA